MGKILNPIRASIARTELRLVILSDTLQGVMEVLDDNQVEADLPTYGQILGAYSLVHRIQMSERLNDERSWSGNASARESLDQLAWTPKYYKQRWLAFRW